MIDRVDVSGCEDLAHVDLVELVLAVDVVDVLDPSAGHPRRFEAHSKVFERMLNILAMLKDLPL